MGARLTSSLCGVILAGGAATRLGSMAKGLANVGGRRIIDQVAEALAPNVDRLAISANADAASSWLDGVPVVPDVLAGGGSAAGIHAALRWARGPVLIVAWDMPFVTASAVSQIAAEGAGGRFDAVVPAGETPGMLEPLCAWYAPSVADAIERAWAAEERSLHRVLQGVRTCVMPRDRFDNPDLLFYNVNTADDLARANALATEAR